MPPLSISVPYEVNYFFTAFTLAACAVLIVVRVYHHRNQKIEHTKLSLTGLSCMVLALLYCSTVLNLRSNWNFGDLRWCDLGQILAATIYCLHRFVLYMFIIFRVDVVNQANLIRPRLIFAAKAVIGMAGIFRLACVIIFSRGFVDEHSGCWYDFTNWNIGLLAFLLLIDIVICVAGTWMLIYSLKQTMGIIEDRRLRNWLRKTKVWSIVCLVSTLLLSLVAVIVDGVVGVSFLFDCTINSLGLVMMMFTKSHKKPYKSSNDSHQSGGVELQVIPTVTKEKPSIGHKRFLSFNSTLSTLRLDKVVQFFIGDDSNDSNSLTA